MIWFEERKFKKGLKKTGTCLLKASNILLYYFVSIKSLLSTTLLFTQNSKQIQIAKHIIYIIRKTIHMNYNKFVVTGELN